MSVVHNRLFAAVLVGIVVTVSVWPFARRTESERPSSRPQLAAEDPRLLQIEARLNENKSAIEQLQQHVIQQGNWIGQLLYRTQDLADRTKWEAEARLLAPEFTPQELALLDRWELNTDALVATPKEAVLPSEPTAAMARPKLLLPHGPQHRYGVGDPKNEVIRLPRRDISIDPNLRLLELKVHRSETQRPEVEAIHDGSSGHPKKQINYYFEFDTVPTFDGAHFWRYPTLVPAVEGVDLTGTRGLHYFVSMTTLADLKPGPSMTFPFRVTAMSLPLPAQNASASDFVKMARLLQFDLGKQESIREVFDYVRHKYVWGGNTLEINALDTFRAGVAGCGHINEMMGAMLEVNGTRVRAVSGFNPIFRVWNPGGGHSAHEVYDGGRWSLIDTFLGHYFSGVAAADLATTTHGEVPAAIVDAPPNRDPHGTLSRALGTKLLLKDLFKYRVYSDKQMRLPVAHMLRLRGAAARGSADLNERTYGLSWPLRTSEVEFDPQRELPEVTTIHVRARYIVSSCPVQGYMEPLCVDLDAVASEWATTSFTIRPRQMLSGAGKSQN